MAAFFGQIPKTVRTMERAIFSAVADAPDKRTIQVESKLFDSIKSFYFKKELLFFLAPSTASETTMTNTAIYFKAVPKTG